MDETSVKVNGVWRYVYQAVSQYGQVIGSSGSVETLRLPVGSCDGR